MSPKHGILHDYDLQANRESSAKGNVCVTCEANPVSYQWADYSGQAMCTRCGTPYQLKWGSDEQQKEGAYPYLSLSDEWAPVAKEYWEETQVFACLGMMIGHKPGAAAFFRWAEANHPELFEEPDTEPSEVTHG